MRHFSIFLKWAIAAYLVLNGGLLSAQTQAFSKAMANAAMHDHFNSPENQLKDNWNYETGTLLGGIQSVWMNSADPTYFQYIQSTIDLWVDSAGNIKTFKEEEKQLDNLLLGRQLLMLYRVTLNPKYALAAKHLYEQIKHQPRTPSGGFWHKNRYPNQMWLDGLYMAEPFYAEYAQVFHHPEDVTDIALQFQLIESHLKDPKTDLLYHAWDESRQQAWADKGTGKSSQIWARAMGWYMMALVDTLDYIPESDPAHQVLVSQLRNASKAILRTQDPKTHLWFQILDKPYEKGNYLESSAACMFVYAFAKGVRQGHLTPTYLDAATLAFQGVLDQFIRYDGQAIPSLTSTVKGVGLGGQPYRDGSYEYYVGEKVVPNDAKGLGAFLLASVEMENAEKIKVGRERNIYLDAWFNSQQRINLFNQSDLYHYKWQDMSNSGYSLLGHVFNQFGAQTRTLNQPPSLDNLKNADVYIIASPDTGSTNPSAHYMTEELANGISDWVQSGGVLMLFENDPQHADIQHMNTLSEKFGIHFNNVMLNEVAPGQYEQGAVNIPGGNVIFKNSHHAFMKEICTISIQSPAEPVLQIKDETLIALSRHGQGWVFATVDPWLYNEYLDGRRLPSNFDNFQASQELVYWALTSVANTKTKEFQTNFKPSKH